MCVAVWNLRLNTKAKARISDLQENSTCLLFNHPLHIHLRNKPLKLRTQAREVALKLIGTFCGVCRVLVFCVCVCITNCAPNRINIRKGIVCWAGVRVCHSQSVNPLPKRGVKNLLARTYALDNGRLVFENTLSPFRGLRIK